MPKEKNKTQLKKWISENCMEREGIKWTDVVNQNFLKMDGIDGRSLTLVEKKSFLELYLSITTLDETIFETYQSYSKRKEITLYCPSNPGHYWHKNDTDKFRREIYDFFVLYVMKLSEKQVRNQLSHFFEEYDELYNFDNIFKKFVKNSENNRIYLLHLMTVLFLIQNESNSYKREKYVKEACNFINWIKSDFFCEGQQIFAETFGMEFDDDVRIYLLKMASEKMNLEASYELAEFYKFNIQKGNERYSWNDVILIYKRIEKIDESGRASWALGKIAEKGYNSEKIDYICAKRYYETAKDCEYSKAYNSLANLYWKHNIPYDDKVKDIEDVIKLYKTAISKGNTYAYINLGHIYSTDKYGCQNLHESAECFEKASIRSSELAKYFQAKLYMNNRNAFPEIDDFCLANMFISMTRNSSQFSYFGKVYEYLAKLLKQNGSLESVIRRGLGIFINQGYLIDRLNMLAWENGSREVIYDLAISTYNNEKDVYLRHERVLHYLEYRNADNISSEIKKKCDDLYERIIKNV